MTSKLKQNIRFQQTSRRIQNRTRYDGFNKNEIVLIKTKKEFEEVERELNKFWRDAPRNENNVVDWDSLSEQKLDWFEYIYKKHEKLSSKLSKIEEKGLDLDDIMYRFMILNVNSVSF